jgi:hypothetical protein
MLGLKCNEMPSQAMNSRLEYRDKNLTLTDQRNGYHSSRMNHNIIHQSQYLNLAFSAQLKPPLLVQFPRVPSKTRASSLHSQLATSQ